MRRGPATARTGRSSLLRFLRSALLGYLLLCLGVYLFQYRLLHHPIAETPAEAGRRFERLGLAPWPSLEDFRALTAKAADQDAERVLVWLHGNAGSAAGQAAMLATFAPLRARVFLYEFPGYGPRAGDLDEESLAGDLAETVDRIAAENPGRPILLMGESLGSAVICSALPRTKAEVAAIVLVTPFSTLGDAAQAMFWFLPARLLARDEYDNVANLRSRGIPLAVVVAGRDRTAPPELGRELFAGYDGPKLIVELPRSEHFDWRDHMGRERWQEIFRFVTAEGAEER